MISPVTLLAPSIANNTTVNSLGEYLKELFPVFLKVCALLAVVMIVWGGLEYILSTIPGAKSSGKEKIWGAIWGLVLALAAYLILNTISPAIFSNNTIFGSIFGP